MNETMAAAARVHIAEHGGDPRDFALLVTGGGGPLHGPSWRGASASTAICPPGAGVASALGMLLAPARVDRAATLARRLDALDAVGLEARFAALEEEARGVIGDTLGAEVPLAIAAPPTCASPARATS